MLLLQREELVRHRDGLHDELVLQASHFSEQQRMLPAMKELISQLSSENSELLIRQASLAAERAELAMTLSKFEALDRPQSHRERCLELQTECDSLRHTAVALQNDALEARRLALDMEHEAHLYKGKLERLERGAAHDIAAAESVSATKKAVHDDQTARVAELTLRLAELQHMQARSHGLQELQNALGSLQGAQKFITALDGSSPLRPSSHHKPVLGMDDSSKPAEHGALKERLSAEEAKVRWLRQALAQSPGTDLVGRGFGHGAPATPDRVQPVTGPASADRDLAFATDNSRKQQRPVRSEARRTQVPSPEGSQLQTLTSPSPAQLAEMCFYLGYEGFETPHGAMAATFPARTSR